MWVKLRDWKKLTGQCLAEHLPLRSDIPLGGRIFQEKRCYTSLNHRIIEFFRLEKKLKIESNCELNTAKFTTKPCPMSTHLLNTSGDGDSTTSLGSLFQCLTTFSVKMFFLISNLNLPWCNLRLFPLVLSLAP